MDDQTKKKVRFALSIARSNIRRAYKHDNARFLLYAQRRLSLLMEDLHKADQARGDLFRFVSRCHFILHQIANDFGRDDKNARRGTAELRDPIYE